MYGDGKKERNEENDHEMPTARCFEDKDAPARRKARSVGDQSAGRGFGGPAPEARRPDLRGRFLFPISPRLYRFRLPGEEAPGAGVRPTSALNWGRATATETITTR